MFNFTFDPAGGILRVRVVGSWTLPEVERYAREARERFIAARQRAGLLRLLVDLSETDILSQIVIDPLAKAGMQYSHPDDRVALVVSSTLLKLQMRRMMGDAPAAIFASADEAAAWLASNESVVVPA
ncbi:MAG TPA: STAS/SEC14 domain-containing protein [Sphingobium sp.]|nr:STAS/SEC14 domain-containing protein [Sphingobium sp.]